MITKLNKFNKKLLLSSILLFTWLILTVNSVYCMPTGHKKNSRQSGIQATVACTRRPGDTPLTPSTTRDRERVRAAKLKTEAPWDLEIPLKGYQIKLNWVDISGRQSCPKKIHKVLTIHLYHRDNVFPSYLSYESIIKNLTKSNSKNDESEASSSYSGNITTSTTPMPNPGGSETTLLPNPGESESRHDAEEKSCCNSEEGSSDELDLPIIVVKGFTDQYYEIPFKLECIVRDLIHFLPVNVLTFEKNEQVDAFEQSRQGVIWDNKCNGYIAYPHLTKVKPKFQKQFNKRLGEVFKDSITESGIEVSDDSTLQLFFNTNLDLVNYNLHAGDFSHKLLECISEGFKLPLCELQLRFYN